MDKYTNKENAKSKLNSALQDYFDAAGKNDMSDQEAYDEIADLLHDMGYSVEILQN